MVKEKVIFFDLWGTLVENGVFPSPVKQIWRILPKRIRFQDFIVIFERTLMTKEYNNLIEGFSEVMKAFDLFPGKSVVDKMVGAWNKNTILASIYPETEKVLKELKKKHNLVLIVNSTPNVKNLIERFEIEKYFDEIILSHEHGFLKTDKELFDIAIERFDVSASDCLMVGDSIKTDILGGENAGVNTLLIDRKDKREYENKIINLEELL